MKGFPRLTVTLPESSDPSSSPPADRPAIRGTTGAGRLPPARVSPWQPPAIMANAMPAERDAMRGDDDMSPERIGRVARHAAASGQRTRLVGASGAAAFRRAYAVRRQPF